MLSGVLQDVFGLEQLRPTQARAVEACLAGRDVTVLLPTGGGKSLCYQLPAILLARAGQGPTLVVSPLLALMDDQVASLARRGVRAVALHSGVPWRDQAAALRELARHELVYVSPERLKNPRLRERLRTTPFARAAIDEAHCISEWGHDFRPEYAELSWLKRELGLPVMALTATATPRVQREIEESLGLRDPERVSAPFLRANLGFHVKLADDGRTRTAWAVEELRALGFDARRPTQRAIVFTITRRRAQQVQRALRKAGIRAGYYHAGRRDSARARAAALFEAGTTPVLVATSAFGMGVDLPGVRAVLHVEAPETLEAYVQQAGRAGRGGEPATCWLAYAPGDRRVHERLAGAAPTSGAREGANALEAYAFGRICRQIQLARHFGDLSASACGACDVCTDPEAVARQLAAAQARTTRARRQQPASDGAAREEEARPPAAPALGEREQELVVAFVDALPKPLGRRFVVRGLRGSRARDLIRKRIPHNPHYGSLKHASEESIFRAIDELLARGLLEPKGRKYPTLWVAGKRVRAGRRATGSGRGAIPPLQAALERFRRNEAKRRRLKPYQVFQNRTLRALCEARPSSHAELRQVWGMGEARIHKYGDALLALVVQARPGIDVPVDAREQDDVDAREPGTSLIRSAG
jgi:ATP-dependent DNA helicase RecQ